MAVGDFNNFVIDVETVYFCAVNFSSGLIPWFLCAVLRRIARQHTKLNYLFILAPHISQIASAARKNKQAFATSRVEVMTYTSFLSTAHLMRNHM